MNSPIHRSWSILLQTVPGASRSLFLFILLTHPAQAIIDVNSNGVSDLWEKTYNSGSLYTNFDPLADTDGDGWTNATEAISGTNPGNANTPTGILRPEIIQSPEIYITSPTGEPEILTPAAVSITWPTLAGKQYTLFTSVDLTPGSWLAIDNDTPRIGTTAPMGNAFPISQPDGSTPPAMFYRLAISDADSDGDTLTNHEEAQLNTDPFSSDTDRDGLPDNTDPAPLSSATLANPDGAGLVNAQNSPLSIASGMIGRWNLEDHQIISNPPLGYTPFQYPDSVGTNPATSHSIFPHPEGMVSKATNHAGGYISIPNAVLGSRKIYSTAFWALLEPGCIAAANGAPVALFGHHYRQPWIVGTTEQTGRFTERFNGVWIEKFGNQERVRAGSRETYNHLNGQPTALTHLNTGISILRPLGTADDGKWHHYTFVHDDAIKTLYIDGVRVGAPATYASPIIPINSIASSISLGRYGGPSPAVLNYNGGSSPTRGRFDRLRIWNRDLTQTEATALYQEDIDKDGLWDITENNRLWRDNNSDTLQTTAERTFSSSPFTWQPTTTDTDSDGLTDIQEQDLGTQISNPDTDGDLLPDGWEDTYQLSPLLANNPDGDTDLDNLSLLDEYRYNTNPTLANSDSDTQNDGAEVNQGSNPNDDSDGGNPIPADQKISILLGIGDESGSESEDYVLNCYRLDPQTGQEQRIYTLRSGGFGEYQEETQSIFKKGESYTFQIDWQSSKLTFLPASPGVTAEGPDCDYTFKVQPQDSNTGLLIDAYDPKTKTVGNPILAEDASNVATTEAEFKDNYERKRVAVVNLKVTWISDYVDAPLEVHIDPWTNQPNGMRCLPDSPNPTVSTYRDIVAVKVTGGLPNLPIWLQSIDVDDTTPESFDTNSSMDPPVIDTNGAKGFDNSPNGSQILGVSKWGEFLGKPENVGFGRYVSKFNDKGDLTAKFRVGTTPGNNYRIAATVKNSAELNGLHSDPTSPDQTNWVSALSSESPTFEGSVSETLTIWRRLWLEIDTMTNQEAPPIGEENWIHGTVASTTSGSPLPSGVPLWNCVFGCSTTRNPNEFENGWLINRSTLVAYPIHDVAAHTSGHFLLRLLSNPGSSGAFTLLDDDNTALPTAYKPILPRLSIDYPYVASKFKPAFIELVSADSYNPLATRTIPFELNKWVLSPDWNNTKDVVDRKSLWAAMAVMAYQSSNELNIDNEDRDPNTENATEGNTILYTGCSVVFLETIRDSLHDILVSSSPFADGPTLLHRSVNLTLAHEISHQPSVIYNGDHSEEGIMTAGGNNGNDADFKSATIARFRRTQQWSVGTVK